MDLAALQPVIVSRLERRLRSGDLLLDSVEEELCLVFSVLASWACPVKTGFSNLNKLSVNYLPNLSIMSSPLARHRG
jgi:hypothetical protein